MLIEESFEKKGGTQSSWAKIYQKYLLTLANTNLPLKSFWDHLPHPKNHHKLCLVSEPGKQETSGGVMVG